MLATSVVSARSSRDDRSGSTRGTTSSPTPSSADEERRRACPVVARASPAESPPPVATAVSDRHEEDRDQVLDDQDADDELAQPPADALLVERLGDDRRAGDRDDRAGEDALERRPAEEPPDDEAEPDHQAALDDARSSPAVGPTWTSLRRLNSSPSENISRITPSSESVWTIAASATSGIGDVRADDQPREDVAEHDRLAQALEDAPSSPPRRTRTSARFCRKSWASCIMPPRLYVGAGHGPAPYATPYAATRGRARPCLRLAAARAPPLRDPEQHRRRHEDRRERPHDDAERSSPARTA